MPTGRSHTGTFPIHARIQGKAKTQTSSPCTLSTATAPALMVVLLFLHEPLSGCPHPGVCRVTLPEAYTTHKWTKAAPGPVHTRRVSAMTLRDSAGERAHQMRGAFLQLVIQRPGARSCSKGPLQCATREIEAAAATAPRHFSRAILLSQRARLGTSSPAGVSSCAAEWIGSRREKATGEVAKLGTLCLVDARGNQEHPREGLRVLGRPRSGKVGYRGRRKAGAKASQGLRSPPAAGAHGARRSGHSVSSRC